MDERAASGKTMGGGSDRVGFGTALVAIFMGGVITGAITSVVNFAQLGRTDALLVRTFASILIGAVAIKVILGFMDANVSLTVAVVTVIVGSVASLAVNLSLTPARLHTESQAAHATPATLPVVGFGFNTLGVLVWIAVLCGQALIIRNFATTAD
jgi:hypothetical protein